MPNGGSKCKMQNEVAKRLLELMELKNLNMNSLAHLSAVPPSTVKNIIYGVSKNTGIVTLKLLCDGMGISITEFFDTDTFRNLDVEEID